MDDIVNFLNSYFIWIQIAFAVSCLIPLISFYFIIHFTSSNYWISHKNKIDNPIINAFRNIIASALIALGILLLFLPGQGTLLIILGFSISTFTGKQKIIKKLLEKKNIRKFLNFCRTKARRKPFKWPS